MKLYEILKAPLSTDEVTQACKDYILAKRPELGSRALRALTTVPAIDFEADGGEWTPPVSPVLASTDNSESKDDLSGATINTEKELPFKKLHKDKPLFSVDRGYLKIENKCQIMVGNVLVKTFKRLQLGKLKPGTDYSIILFKDGTMKLVLRDNLDAYKSAGRHIGGFHFDLGAKVVRNSFWDLKFRPSADLPGLKMVECKSGRFWDYIYFMGQDLMSRAGVIPADGGDYPPNGFSNLSWNTVTKIAEGLGCRLLTREEFAASMAGTKEGAVTQGKPKKTERVPGLLSKSGSEQAIGALWCWLSETHETYGEPYKYVAGGSYGDAGDSGPRYLLGNRAGSSRGFVGARLRCDHLELE